MDYIKNCQCVCASMTQSKLNHCMLLRVHKDRTDSIDTKDIASEFIQNCSTHTAYFGSF